MNMNMGAGTPAKKPKFFWLEKVRLFPHLAIPVENLQRHFSALLCKNVRAERREKTMRQIRENSSQRIIFEGGFVYGKWKKKV